jgi:hypothetical protein
MIFFFSKLKSLNKNKVQSSVIGNNLGFSFPRYVSVRNLSSRQWSKFTQTRSLVYYLVMRTVTDLAFHIQNKSGFRHFTMVFLENSLQGSSGLNTWDGIYGTHVAAFLKLHCHYSWWTWHCFSVEKFLRYPKNYAQIPRKYRNSRKQLIFFSNLLKKS